MKRLTLLLFCVLVMSNIWARPYVTQTHSAGSSFELSVGAGYGTLGYGTQDAQTLSAKNVGSWSATAHVGYNYFFVEWVGIGIGVDYTRYGSVMQLDGTMQWNGVGDTDGEKYQHTLSLSPWKETQQVGYLEPSVAIKLSIPAGSIYVIGEVGGKYGLALHSEYTGSGTLTHTGYYKPWDLTLENIDAHGFYTTKDYHPKGALDKPDGKFSIYGKVGVLIPLIEHLDLMAQVYGQYALTGSAVGGDIMPGYLHDMDGMEEAHYFMSDYSSWTKSPLVTGTIKPWVVGLEVGIRYTIPHVKNKHCVCHWVE